MTPQRTAILLAPLSLATVPSQAGFTDARSWQEREHAMRPLLGEAFYFPIESAELTDVGIAKLLPSGVNIAQDGHDCTVFKSGVAIIQLRLTFDDARPLLQQWPGDGEKQLPVRMYKLGNKILSGSLDRTRSDVDWTYYIVDTDSYIDSRFDNQELQSKFYANGPVISEPLRLDNEAGTRLWVEWSATQIAAMRDLKEAELPLARIVDVFVIRCACWQLLIVCGQRAVQALATFSVGATQEGSVASTAVADLRNLQLFGSQLLVSYTTSLWTSDQNLVDIFDAVDTAWNVEREVAKTRNVLEQVTTALETQHAAELERRNQELEKRDRRLGATALSLAVLTLVSAVSDMFTIEDKLTATRTTVIAFTIPIALVLATLGVMKLVSR